MNLREVTATGVSASFFAPDGPPRPGILILGGSEGGRPRYLARLLASQGFSCMALSYFGAKPLPRNLVEVPVEYVETALRWLAERPETLDSKIGLLGASKGAELALLTAALMPESIGAVVVFAPSAVTFAGIAFGSAGRRRSSWSFGARPVPFVPYPPGVRPALCLQGLSLAPMYEAGLDDAAAVAAASIPVERVRAPIMLISGGRDRMWPSLRMAEMIKARFAEYGKGGALIHLDFPDAGHSIMPWAPGSEMTLTGRLVNAFRLAGNGGLFALGGKPQANRAALNEAWPQVTEFFREHLNGPGGPS